MNDREFQIFLMAAKNGIAILEGTSYLDDGFEPAVLAMTLGLYHNYKELYNKIIEDNKNER